MKYPHLNESGIHEQLNLNQTVRLHAKKTQIYINIIILLLLHVLVWSLVRHGLPGVTFLLVTVPLVLTFLEFKKDYATVVITPLDITYIGMFKNKSLKWEQILDIYVYYSKNAKLLNCKVRNEKQALVFTGREFYECQFETVVNAVKAIFFT